MPKKANIKITFVKVANEIEIHYEERHDKGMGTIKFTSEDKPRKQRTSEKYPAHESGLDVKKVKKDIHKK